MHEFLSWFISAVFCLFHVTYRQLENRKRAWAAHDVTITSLLRQNDVATSFWRNNDVIITSCVRWDVKRFWRRSLKWLVPNLNKSWQRVNIFISLGNSRMDGYWQKYENDNDNFGIRLFMDEQQGLLCFCKGLSKCHNDRESGLNQVDIAGPVLKFWPNKATKLAIPFTGLWLHIDLTFSRQSRYLIDVNPVDFSIWVLLSPDPHRITT